ncbi:trypsin-like peptidase domain-containing protein [Alsobacter sp. R-9]
MSWRTVVSVAIAAACLPGAGLAAPSLQLGGSERWVVLAARQALDEATDLARRYGREVDGLRVVRSANGWFAVVLGPMPVNSVAAAQARLDKRLWLPSDAYLSRGEKFVETVYEAPLSPVRAFAAYEGKAPVTVTWGDVQLTLEAAGGKEGRVPTLVGRTGGRTVFSTRLEDAARETPNGEARLVRLDPRTPSPQIVFSAHWGGAHCCTVTHVLTPLAPGQWHVVEAETLDGSGYAFEDIDGDGAAELVSVDNSFLYAFDSYAGSFAPARVHRLEGATLRDVSDDPRMRAFMRTDLARMEAAARADTALWRSNGFLAGWVAAKARVGEGDAAWARMLESYDRNSDFPTTECTLPLALDKCPKDRQRTVPFPEALRAHLLKNGYPAPGGGEIVVRPRAAEVAPSVVGATPVGASYQDAEAAFLRLPEASRYDLQMMMIAAGHWPAVSTDTFSRRLHEAIQKAQADAGLPPSGVPDAAFVSAMRAAAAPQLTRWGLAAVPHPAAGGLRLWVPRGLGLTQTATRNGMEFATSPRTLRVNYGFYPGLTVKAAYDAALSALQAPTVIQYKVQRPDFFAISSAKGEVGSYARYHAVRGGLLGFTLDWANDDAVRGDRLSTLMSDLFRAETMGMDRRPPVPAPAMVASLPPSAAAAPPSTPAPAPQVSRRSTGTAFFVTGEGHALTNHHVVDGCTMITVSLGTEGPRPARVVARDTTNDLAVLKVDTRPAAIAPLRSGIRLGDGVAVFGFPLTGLLTTSGNFTLGNVTALAGIRDDSRMLQISAPVQPGNSGGPLLDETGAVVGVVVAKLNALKLAAATDDLAQNVNFAIKGSVAQAFAESQGLRLDTAAPDRPALKPADLAERAKAFTGLVDCAK